MMRDIQIIRLGDDEVYMATDNSGAIGLKELDVVHAPYELVSYFSFRVAAMELLAAGAIPEAVIMTNFCGDAAWPALMDGIKQGLDELALVDVSIGGSTESNFTLSQSALGLTIVGKKVRQTLMSSIPLSANTRFAVIGQPLVGGEVLIHRPQVAPMHLLQNMSYLEGVVTLPIGSKGIAAKVQRLLQEKVEVDKMECELDVVKSSGPATCFLVAFPENQYDIVKDVAGKHYHELTIIRDGREIC